METIEFSILTKWQSDFGPARPAERKEQKR